MSKDRADTPFAALNAYELRHLIEHLGVSDREDAIHRILTMESAERTNAWFVAKEAADDVDGFVADATRARQRSAKRNLTDGGERELLYAVRVASVRSLAETLPTELVVQLVETGIWTLARGAAFIRQIPDEDRRAEGLAGLSQSAAGVAAADLAAEALRTVAAINNERERSKAMAIGPLPEAHQAQLVNIARGIADGYYRSTALLQCAQATKDADLKRRIMQSVEPDIAVIQSDRRRRTALVRLLKLAGSIGEFGPAWRRVASRDRAEVLADVAALFDTESVDDGINAAKEIADNSRREEAIVHLVDRLVSLDQPQRATNIATSLEGSFAIAESLAVLALGEAVKQRTDAALALANRVTWKGVRVRTIARIALMSTRDWRPVFAAALKGLSLVFDVNERAEIQRLLAECAARHGDGDAALQFVRGIAVAPKRASALALIAPTRPAETVELAMDLVTSIGFASVSEAVRALPPAERQSILRRVLAVERQIGDGEDCLRAVSSFGPLTAASGAVALQMAETVRDEHARARALAALASVVDDTQVSKLDALAATITDATAQAAIIAVIWPRKVKTAGQASAVLEAPPLADAEFASKALIDVAVLLPPVSREPLFAAAAGTAARITRAYPRVSAMAKLASAFPPFVRDLTEAAIHEVETLAAAYERGGNVEGASEAAAVAEAAASSMQPEGLRRLATALTALKEDLYRDRALTALITRLVDLGALDAANELSGTLKNAEHQIHARLAMTGALGPSETEAELDAIRVDADARLDGIDRVRVLLAIERRTQRVAERLRACADGLALIDRETPGHRVEVEESLSDDDDLRAALSAVVAKDGVAGRQMWSAAVGRLAEMRRDYAVALLRRLAPAAITGDAAAGIVLSVMRWWP